MSYSKERDKIERLFTGPTLKYEVVKAAVTPGLSVGRGMFIDRCGARPHVEVVLDRLDMNHIIDFKNMLEVDYATIRFRRIDRFGHNPNALGLCR